MKINPGLFRAYDIRGLYPQEINNKVAYLIGEALVRFLKKRRPKIVVARDNRLSSPLLHKSFVQGIIEKGANVVDIGLATTPMLYFAVAHYKFEGGVIITASHNPPRYNGFKLVKEKSIPINEKTGLKEIKNLVLKRLQPTGHLPGKLLFKKNKKGKIIKKKILKDYLNFVLKNADLKKIKSLKIVIDTANGVGGIVVSRIFKKIPCKVYHLFPELDGNFPNHLPDPLIKANLKKLKQEVKRRKANLGIAFDGDGDRIIFVDEKGKEISADLICALVVNLILKVRPGEKILCDLRSSNIIEEVVLKAGGIPVRGRVGHSFIKEKMRKDNIFFAGEFSGHYYLKKHYFCESPFFVLFKILEELSKTKKKLSHLIEPFKKYYHSGEINFKVENEKRVIEKLEKKYSRGRISQLDGLRVDFGNWWFNIRSSHTEPVLRLVIEAKTKKIMEEKKKEIVSLIKKL